MQMHYLIAGLIGLFSGLTAGLFGVGGGIVMVPAMIFLLKTDIRLAIGTSLAIIIPTALSGAFKHYQQNNVDLKLALTLAPMAIIGAYFGAHLVETIPQQTLKRMFGGFLILAGAKLLIEKRP